MKKIFIYLTIILLATACSKTPSYKIIGNIKGQDGIIILSRQKADGTWLVSDSTELIEGKFTFEGSVNNPEQCHLVCRSRNSFAVFIPFIIDNSVININADINDRSALEIIGSPAHDMMNSYKESVALFTEKKKKLKKAYTKANQANDKKKMEEIKAEKEDVEKEINHALYTFVKNNNKSCTAALIAYQQIRGKKADERAKEADEIDEIIALFDISLMEHDYVVNMKTKAKALRSIVLGKIAPEFSLKNTEGEIVKLSSLLGKGYLLVEFWAAWCGPCRAESPHIIAAYNEFHDKGFEIFGVSLDGA